MFSNKKNIWLTSSSFLNDTKMISAELSKIVVDHYVFPEDESAIDHSNIKIIKKMASEYFERRTIGFNSFRKDDTWRLRGRKISLVKRKEVGYGFSKTYGFLDTTGTSAGVSSNELKKKALTELLEKNESMLFWYTDKFYGIEIDDVISSIVKSLGLADADIYMFYANELSNAHTVITLCFYDNNLVSSGISCSLVYDKAIEDSLLEAKMLLSVYIGRGFSPIKNLMDKDYQNSVYPYIKEKFLSSTKLTYTPPSVERVIVKDWIKPIDYIGLNIVPMSCKQCIRCCSIALMNCMPYRQNLLSMPTKLILKKFDVLNHLDSDIPDYSLY